MRVWRLAATAAVAALAATTAFAQGGHARYGEIDCVWKTVAPTLAPNPTLERTAAPVVRSQLPAGEAAKAVELCERRHGWSDEAAGTATAYAQLKLLYLDQRKIFHDGGGIEGALEQYLADLPAPDRRALIDAGRMTAPMQDALLAYFKLEPGSGVSAIAPIQTLAALARIEAAWPALP